MARKYRRNRRTRKKQPRIRWTSAQQGRLATAVENFNGTVEHMIKSGLYVRTGKYGTYHSVPDKLDYEYEKSRIGSRVELNEFVSMVNDLANIDPEAVTNRRGANVNAELHEKLQPYLDKKKAQRWNARENEAERRGYESWDEIPPEVQRAIYDKNPELREPQKQGSEFNQLGALTDRYWYGDRRMMENYGSALVDNGYDETVIDFINEVMERLTSGGEEGALREVVTSKDPRAKVQYLYDSDNPAKEAPFKMKLAQRQANLVRYWEGVSERYGLGVSFDDFA